MSNFLQLQKIIRLTWESFSGSQKIKSQVPSIIHAVISYYGCEGTSNTRHNTDRPSLQTLF